VKVASTAATSRLRMLSSPLLYVAASPPPLLFVQLYMASPNVSNFLYRLYISLSLRTPYWWCFAPFLLAHLAFSTARGAIAPASLSRPNQASLGKEGWCISSHQRALSPNINISDHSSATNINFVPTTSKQLVHLPNNKHPTWLEARENHLAASRPEARSEPMVERSNRATRARLAFRLVVREAKIHLLEVFWGYLRKFRGLHRCWRSFEGHPAKSRHTDKQERDGWEAWIWDGIRCAIYKIIEKCLRKCHSMATELEFCDASGINPDSDMDLPAADLKMRY
jgi:hypothetical protein